MRRRIDYGLAAVTLFLSSLPLNWGCQEKGDQYDDLRHAVYEVAVEFILRNLRNPDSALIPELPTFAEFMADVESRPSQAFIARGGPRIYQTDAVKIMLYCPEKGTSDLDRCYAMVSLHVEAEGLDGTPTAGTLIVTVSEGPDREAVTFGGVPSSDSAGASPMIWLEPVSDSNDIDSTIR